MISSNEAMIIYLIGLIVGVGAGVMIGWGIFAPAAKRKPGERPEPRCVP